MMSLRTRAPMQVTVVDIPDGDAGTQATIAAMRVLIDEGMQDPTVRELAVSILQRARVRAYDWRGEIRAIYDAVRRNLRFTRDVRGKETLHTAPEIIRLKSGDCDDYTVLICALLGAIGHKTQIVTIAAHRDAPDVLTHVFPEVWLDGSWIALDAARRDPQLGKQPRTWFRRIEWDTQSPEFAEVAGLAGFGSNFVPGPAAATRPLNPRMPRRLRAALGFVPGPRRAPAYAPRGFGNYGRPALARLGDISTDLTSLESAFPSLATGTADIITAARANPNNLVPTTAVGQGSQSFNSSLLSSSVGGLSLGTLLLLGGIVVVGVVIARKQ